VKKDKETGSDDKLVSFIKRCSGTKRIPGPLYRNFVGGMVRDLPKTIRELEEIRSLSY